MIKKIIFFLSLYIFWSTAGAFGLGELKIDSALNEPLNARVALISVLPEEIDNIKVRLAGPDLFARAGIPRPFYLSKLRFKLVAPENGDSYIRITTRESVREPFLNFLLEVVWSRGNMVREFTALLDPPTYTPPRVARTRAAKAAPPAPVRAQAIPQPVQNYGPVRSSDTLWVIAGKVQASSSVSRNQTMMALLKANPNAFVNGNINQLKRDVLLTVPRLEEVAAITRAEANAMVRQQMAEWRQGRASAKMAAVGRPGPSSVSATRPGATAAPEKSATDRVDEVAGSEADTAESARTGEEETASKQLRVLDADGNWVVSDENDKRYPARESDKIREAIRDSEQELVAVQAINKDILELRTALESKVEALKKALEEKDAQLESLRKQIEQADEKATVAVQGSRIASSDAGAALSPTPEQTGVPAGNVTASTVVKEPMALSSYWKDEYWIYLMGAVIVILSILLLLSMRRKDRVHQLTTPELFQVSAEEAGLERQPFPHEESSSVRSRHVETAPVQPVVPDFDALQEVELEPDGQRSGGDIASVLTEADIYLAYRRYSQAESLVEEVMRQHPESPDLKAKLLEIYAFRRDAKLFQRYLDQVYPVLKSQSPDLWQKVVEMGRDLVPDHPAFESGYRATTAAAAEGGSPTPAMGDDDPLPDDLFDIDLDLPDDEHNGLPSSDDDAISIEGLMDDRPMPDHHEIPSIDIELDEDDLNLDFDDDQKPRR